MAMLIYQRVSKFLESFTKMKLIDNAQRSSPSGWQSDIFLASAVNSRSPEKRGIGNPLHLNSSRVHPRFTASCRAVSCLRAVFSSVPWDFFCWVPMAPPWWHNDAQPRDAIMKRSNSMEPREIFSVSISSSGHWFCYILLSHPDILMITCSVCSVWVSSGLNNQHFNGEKWEKIGKNGEH